MYYRRCYSMLVSLFSVSLLFAEKPLVVTTASIFEDMAKTIGGEYLEVRSIVPVGSDPHLYEATPKDAQLVASAQLIMVNGLNFEGWLSELIQFSGTKAVVDTLTRDVKAIASDKYTNSYDPHAWMSVENARIYIKNIYNIFSKIDPKNQIHYKQNYERYDQQLTELDDYVTKKIAAIPFERRVLITSHDAFRYYGRRYGLRIEPVMGTSTDADVETSAIVRLRDIILKQGVPAVFVESTINPKLLEQLAADTGARVGGHLYADSLGEPTGEAGTYLKMIKYNTNIIFNALSAGGSEKQNEETNFFYFWLSCFCAVGLAVFFVLMLKIN